MPKDLFSQQASLYAKYRPVYPVELYEYLLSLVTEKNTAWDCATGNGQAAAVLADHFQKVYATDISEKQLQQAVLRDNIVYSVTAAEKTPFGDNQFDCITVAQAYHWFDFTAFHKEVTRVAKPGAIIAVWGYGLVSCVEEKLNSFIGTFYRDTVGPYWDKERKWVDKHYASIPFPYEELPPAGFTIAVSWTKDDLEGYLNTWSSVQHYMKANGQNPVTAFCETLAGIWPDNNERMFYFPLFLRIGKVK
jgi:ubiquinone/menaquinone biosynthesis C-methylase UbiE